MPLNNSGKVDRKALPAPTFSGIDYKPPSNDTEATMCEMWQQLLKVDLVGVDDDWFALGGHSLLAMQLARLSGHSVASIMANPTVAEPDLASSRQNGTEPEPGIRAVWKPRRRPDMTPTYP